jgi:membrane fusion protein (multidrug efflux system)
MNKIITLLSISTLLVFCSCKKTNQVINTTDQDDILKVQIYQVKKEDVPLTLTYLGNFKPYKEAVLGTSIPGKIEKIYYDEGSTVKQGDLLIQMSSELLLQAEAEYRTLEKDYQRVKNLAEKQSISQQDYDHVKAKYDAATARYNLLKSNTEIRAPFDGIIAKHLAHEGENYFFSASLEIGSTFTSGIVQLVKINPIYFEFEISEKDLTFIKNKTPVRAIANIYPKDTIIGYVDFISPTLNPTKATATIRIKINNATMKYKPGMTGKAFINVIRHDIMLIPLKGIIKELTEDSYFVYTVDKFNKINKKNITILEYIGQYVAVEGLNIDDKVVISSKKNLKEGLSVNIIEIIKN